MKLRVYFRLVWLCFTFRFKEYHKFMSDEINKELEEEGLY